MRLALMDPCCLGVLHPGLRKIGNNMEKKLTNLTLADEILISVFFLLMFETHFSSDPGALSLSLPVVVCASLHL